MHDIHTRITELAITNQEFAKTPAALSRFLASFKGSLFKVKALFPRRSTISLTEVRKTEEATLQDTRSAGLHFGITDSAPPVTKLKPYRGKRIEGNSTAPSVQSSYNDRFRIDFIAYPSAEKLWMLMLLIHILLYILLKINCLYSNG